MDADWGLFFVITKSSQKVDPIHVIEPSTTCRIQCALNIRKFILDSTKLNIYSIHDLFLEGRQVCVRSK